MVNKKNCIRIFNSMINNIAVSFQDDLLPLYSDYLLENKIKDSDKLINFIIKYPELIKMAFPKIIEYYRNKYNIFRLDKLDQFNRFNTILYYE